MLNELGSWITTRTSLLTIRHGLALGFVNYKKGALDSLTTATDKVYQLLAHGRWFSPVRILRLLPPLKLVVMI